MKQDSSLKRVPIEVLGHQYFVRTDGDEEHVRRVADYVNNKSREIMEATHTISTVDLFIKVAINLADELLQERSAREMLREQVAQEVQDLIRGIDLHLKEVSEKP
ncbi:MAG: cell division protein ZapA [bacterium]